MGGLTLWLTQQFISSPSVKYWLVPKLHPSTTSGFVGCTVDSNILFYRAKEYSTSQMGRMHQYYHASWALIRVFTPAAMVAATSRNAQKVPFRLIQVTADT